MIKFLSLCDFSKRWQTGFQDPATPVMEGIIDLHHSIFFFLIVILITVLLLFLKNIEKILKLFLIFLIFFYTFVLMVFIFNNLLSIKLNINTIENLNLIFNSDIYIEKNFYMYSGREIDSDYQSLVMINRNHDNGIIPYNNDHVNHDHVENVVAHVPEPQVERVPDLDHDFDQESETFLTKIFNLIFKCTRLNYIFNLVFDNFYGNYHYLQCYFYHENITTDYNSVVLRDVSGNDPIEPSPAEERAEIADQRASEEITVNDNNESSLSSSAGEGSSSSSSSSTTIEKKNKSNISYINKCQNGIYIKKGDIKLTCIFEISNKDHKMTYTLKNKDLCLTTRKQKFKFLILQDNLNKLKCPYYMDKSLKKLETHKEIFMVLRENFEKTQLANLKYKNLNLKNREMLDILFGNIYFLKTEIILTDLERDFMDKEINIMDLHNPYNFNINDKKYLDLMDKRLKYALIVIELQNLSNEILEKK